MSERFDIVFVGLTLSSSWGNGHATTFRSLIKGLAALGRRVLFLERDKPWYAANRDLPDPDFCTLRLYDSVDELVDTYGATLAEAGAVIVGSYVPDGVEVIDRLRGIANGRLHFYDIDTPVTLARLKAGDEEYLAPRQIPLFETYFSFTGGPTLERLRQEFGARRAAPLYCSVEPELYRNTGAEKRWDLGYLGTYSPDRQPTLERLLIEPARQLPKKHFVVAGPQYPETIDWPANVERIDHLPPAEHAAFYSRQRFTLNVTRADMIAAGWSPSVGCSRRPRSAFRSSATPGRGSTACCPTARRSALPVEPKTSSNSWPPPGTRTGARWPRRRRPSSFEATPGVPGPPNC